MIWLRSSIARAGEYGWPGLILNLLCYLLPDFLILISLEMKGIDNRPRALHDFKGDRHAGTAIFDPGDNFYILISGIPPIRL